MSATAVGAGTPSRYIPQQATSTSPEPHGHASFATGVRYDRSMLSRADDLAKMTVLDEAKQSIELGTLWRDQPAVLVFVRHFG